ncbi:unnamed protein product [Brachionus calyciflorus]|uniref:H-type lectin domain-containing protein n=1 Tax=Brachionus calyciflorus TaxID=104777 RepID=A0A813YHX5_9BILA|nr:unnamed protein product [Brachionus calyciflorus]
MRIEFLIILSWIITLVLSDSKNDVVFDLADITVDFDTFEDQMLLEAFKVSTNDQIIENRQSEKYGQLNWVTIGYPSLMHKKNENRDIFNFNPEGFDIHISLLTEGFKKVLAETASNKYNITVHHDQIVSLKPENFLCHIIFFDDNNEKIVMNGKAVNTYTSPVKINFNSYQNSRERLEFEKKIQKDGTNLDLDITCEINSHGKSYKQNTLTINGNQINQLNLQDEIFGPSNSVYVTRNQLSTLSHKLYQDLNIVEEYQIPEHEFSQKFIDDFISQTSEFVNKYTPIDEVLKNMSKYDLKEDLKPDILKQELSKIFKIEKIGSLDVINANSEEFETDKKSSSSDLSLSGSGSKKAINVSASVNYAKSKKNEWSKTKKSIENQLKDLNSYSENNIEWQRNGKIIQPKSIKVSKLSKLKLVKGLRFKRIRREYYDAKFKRFYRFSTRDINDYDFEIYTFKDGAYWRFKNFDTEMANLVENINLNMPSPKIQSGSWILDNSNTLKYYKNSGGDRFYTLRANLNNFTQTPQVIYGIKKYYSYNNNKFYYKIEEKEVTRTSVNYEVVLYKISDDFEFEIQWVAIGY